MRGQMRRSVTAFVLACLLLGGASPLAVSRWTQPVASPEIGPPGPEGLFPSAGEVGDALGLTVEATGVRTDMSQLWEGTEIAPGALVAAWSQGYRSVAGGATGSPDDPFAGVILEIDRFQSADDAARYGGAVASRVSEPLVGFPTALSADLVATGSWISDGGFGGSTIVARTGPLVVIVTAARAGVTEMETATEVLTGLVLERLLDETPAPPVTTP